MKTREMRTVEELREFAKEVLSILKVKEPPHIIGVSGDLGSGKTAFTKALAEVLGIKDDITSPTFVIMKSYEVKNHALYRTLVHIDAYRIEKEAEMEVVRFNDVIGNPQNLVVVEWPERIGGLMPENTFSINLKIDSGETRAITYGG